ncbi:hypothetical protein CONLIGDRAFT_386937 [Coniochaeta ligniaria NRRL 30616]|uniref:WD40 repeat-like protein n=1 Tax=Coniochaeta ligniaria NRRL 30616 TaxID=1408157 RepID=A0A1J7JH19_9PEZI|nr:hypothetical protein CONLIGDRAFT_386937 [Coniochaeta ligniaria NRRL 30616]
MVRTRRTNKTKRYTEYAVGADDDDQDGAAQPADAGADDLSDFAAEHAENEVSAPEDDETEADDDDAAEFSEPASNAPRTPRRRNNPRKSQITASAKHGVDYHELPGYPLDPRISTRAYTGPLKRGVRSGILRDVMYGPEYSKAKLIWDLNERWTKYAVLPSRHPPQHPEGVLASPWVPPGFELDQEKLAAKWYDEYMVLSTEKSRSHPVLAKHGARLIPQGQGDLAVLLGPVKSQKECRFTTSAGMALSAAGLPVDEPDTPGDAPNGWMFDVGGIVVALGWAPILTGDKQILSLAVVPHSDQANPVGDQPDTTAEDEKRHGSIQFWEFAWDRDEERRPRPSPSPPKFLSAKCFDWGRPKRMQWCPVSFGMAGLYGMLAVLCGDGRVRVLDAKPVDDSETTVYEWIDAPVATLGFTDNYNVEATCFTWMGLNRLALGHTDGSITLWSIFPTQMLQRHAVHASHVLDISSGYPSMPHMVASVPVGGFTTLVDLTSPTGESTYVNAPGIQFQPGVLDWNDHLQGWLVLAPAGGPGLNTLVFLSVRYFPLAKSMLTSMSMPLCVSVHGNHPYALVGCADGSVWSFNALSKLFRQRDEDSFKIKIFEHEFRPTDAIQPLDEMEMAEDGGSKLRGASRLLQGFFPEVNDDPRSERLRELNKKKQDAMKKPAKGKNKSAQKAATGADEDISAHMASRMVIHEPLTRVSATAWNPNVEFGTWAAVALGSGLVRVMDVGVE